jgi:glucosylceramidase
MLHVQIRTSDLTKCIGVASGSTTDGARVVLYTCDGSPNQQWKFVSTAAGVYTLNPKHIPSKCMDVIAGNNKVQIWQCDPRANAIPNQKWKVKV